MATLWESAVERGDICSLTVLLITNTLVLEPKQRVCLFYSHKFLEPSHDRASPPVWRTTPMQTSGRSTVLNSRAVRTMHTQAYVAKGEPVRKRPED